MKLGETVSEWGNGKFKAELMPQVYFDFVSELHKDHQDLLSAMAMAQVKLSDWSAFEFLNQFLNVDVPRDMPLEKGFGIYLVAIRGRASSRAAEREMAKVASQYKTADLFPNIKRDRTKPLFEDTDKPSEIPE